MNTQLWTGPVNSPIMHLETNDGLDYLHRQVENPTSYTDKSAAPLYIAGTLAGQLNDSTTSRRDKNHVQSRWALILDLDHSPVPPRHAVESLGLEAIAHTTWSHTEESQSWRLIFPLSEPIPSGEYPAACAGLAARLREVQADLPEFDASAQRAAQGSYLPSQRPGYQHFAVAGARLDVAAARRQAIEQAQTPPAMRGRPRRPATDLPGVAGVVARKWGVAGTIAYWDLPYEGGESGPWLLEGSTHSPGLVLTPGERVYSHHATDPACGALVGAVDPLTLAGLHRHGSLNPSPQKLRKMGDPSKWPSSKAMVQEATSDPTVLRLMTEDAGIEELPTPSATPITHSSSSVGIPTETQVSQPDPDPATDSTASAGAAGGALAWVAKLAPYRNKNGELKLNSRVIQALFDNDPVVHLIVPDVRENGLRWTVAPPWRGTDGADYSDGDAFSEGDEEGLAGYLETRYGLVPSQALTAARRVVNRCRNKPAVDRIRGEVEALRGSWDGKDRLGSNLLKTMGADDTETNRVSLRIALAQALRRLLEPGCQADYVLTLVGGEGRGKTTFVRALSLGHTVTIPEVTSKDSVMKLSGAWIADFDELETVRRSDWATVRTWLTETEDRVRLPYAREVTRLLRRSCVWATTNDHTFLDYPQGARRFLPVTIERNADFKTLHDKDWARQVWAQCWELWPTLEALEEAALPTAEEHALLARGRETHIADPIGDLAGEVGNMLDSEVPEDHDEMPLGKRKLLWSRIRSGELDEVKQTGRVQRVCARQAWVEVLGRDERGYTRQTAREISAALRRAGWKQTSWQTIPGYGRQRVFIRSGNFGGLL